MKRSHNKILQWHKIRWFHANDKCFQAVLTCTGISVQIWVEILIKTPAKHGFWPIILQYPLRYFSQIVEKTCGIFLRLHSGKKSLRSTFFQNVPHRTSTADNQRIRVFVNAATKLTDYSSGQRFSPLELLPIISNSSKIITEWSTGTFWFFFITVPPPLNIVFIRKNHENLKSFIPPKTQPHGRMKFCLIFPTPSVYEYLGILRTWWFPSWLVPVLLEMVCRFYLSSVYF